MHRAAVHPHARPRQRGFTLVELVMVIVLTGILAFVAVPRLGNLGGFDSLGYHDQIVAAVRHGQKTAMAQRGYPVCLDVTTVPPSLCFLASGSACAAGTAITLPGGGMAAPAAGITVSTSAGNSFCFDGSGRPIDAGSRTALATAITITVTGDPTRAFRVEPETGYIHVLP